MTERKEGGKGGRSYDRKGELLLTTVCMYVYHGHRLANLITKARTDSGIY